MSTATPGHFFLARLQPVQESPPPPMTSLSPEGASQAEAFNTTHALTLILTVLLLVLFFVGFFSIYFCRCFMENLMSIINHRGRSPMGAPVNPSNPDPPGLDPEIIESFPAFEYSSVKDFRRESYGLECAICLSEFQDDDSLRLIPECSHVFHMECIDLWLASHKSCPVCRRGLDPAADDPPNPEEDGPESGARLNLGGPDCELEARGRPEEDSPSYSILIKEDDDRNYDRSPVHLEKGVIFYEKGRFSRSHSTGHSIVRMDEDERAAAGAATGEDKYTLRLPEHVKEKITRGHVQTLSCTTFGDMSREKGQGRRSCFGEISGSYKL